MQLVKALALFCVSFGVAFAAVSFADAQEVSFASEPVWLSTSRTTEGETVILSTVVTKNGTDAMSGAVEFFANGTSIGTKDFSLPADVGGAVVSVSFVPSTGTHAVSVKISRAVVMRAGGEEPLSVTAEAKAETLVIEPDNDRDKISDAEDPDDDNDGVSDTDEKANGTDPLKKPETPAPTVAGASTTALASVDTAKDLGAKIFAQTETLRESMADYFEKKIDENEQAKAAKQAAASEVQDIEEKLVNPKPLSEQLQDTSGIVERFKIQFYKIGSFLTGNVIAFYALAVIILLAILRKLWRRHSLD